MNLPDFVRAGRPISASNMNRMVGVVRARPWRTHARGMPRSRAVGAAAEKPFEITLSQRDGTWYARSAAGKWFGRGTGGAVHGVMPRYKKDSDGWLTEPWPEIGEDFYDAFQIHACEWELGATITGKRYVFFIMAEKVFGGGFVSEHPRIYMAEEAAPTCEGSESELDKLLFRDNFVALAIVADVRVGYSASTESSSAPEIETLQILSSDYHYTPPPCTTAPFVFHRVHATTNTWRCFGGVVRVIPTRWRGTDYWQEDISAEIIESGAESVPSDASSRNNASFCEAVEGTEISFGEADIEKMGDGAVVFLDVTVFTNSDSARTKLQCDWILRSLSAAGLSRSETSVSETVVEGTTELYSICKTPDKPQVVYFYGENTIASSGYNNKGPKIEELGVRVNVDTGEVYAGAKRFRTAVPMAIFRRVGNSKFVEVQTLQSGVVEVRAQLELQHPLVAGYVGPWSPYVYSGCEGAVSQGAKEEAQITTEEAKVISESGNAPTETASVSSYALENEDFAAVARGASGEEAQG